MSDEEKKAIDIVKGITEDDLLNYWEGREEPYNAIQIVLSLIEKQSKEIEDHIENKELINQTLGLKKNANINKTLEKIIILNNYEDKIKAKIEEIDRKIEFEQNEKVIIYLHKQKRVLLSLLEKE